MGDASPPKPPAAGLGGRDRLAREPNTGLPLEMPGPRRVLRLVWRAITLRCPHCGGRPVLVHWLRMRERCGACGMALERGESDYFIGSMMFNVILSEFLFAGVFVAYLLVRWPDVPWDTIQWVAPAGMALAPVLLYPVSKLSWLAFDLALRPSSREP